MPQTVMRHSSRNARTPTRAISPSVAAGAVFLLALVPRLGLYHQLQDIPFFRSLVSDSLLYMRLADAIAAGSAPAKAYFMSPLYPYLLAVISAVGGDPYVWVRLVQCVLGAGMCALLVPLGALLASKRAGVLAGVIAAVYPLFWFYDNSILLESIQAFLGVCHLLCLFFALRKGRTGWYVSAGVSAGFLVVLRASTGLYVALLTILLVVVQRRQARQLRKPAVLLLAALLPIAPFTVHNYRAEGVFLPVASSAGFNFHAGNNPASPGLYKMPSEIDVAADPNGEGFAEARTGKEMNSAEVSSYWMRISLEWIAAHPGEYLSLLARKAALYFSPRENDQLGLSPAFVRRQYGTIMAIRYPDFILVLALAAGGMYLHRRKGLESGILFLFIAASFLSTVAFFVSGRLRIPVTPAYILFAAVFIDAAASALRERKARAIAVPAVLAAVVAAVAFLAQPDVRESFELEYSRLGQHAFDRGDYAGAEGHYLSSLGEAVSLNALIGAGNASAARGKFDAAAGLYQRAVALAPASALVHFNMGNMLMQKGDASGAYRAWRQAIAVQPGFAPAHRNLGLLLARAGRLEDALSELRLYRSLESDRTRREEIDRDITAIERIVNAGK